MNNYLVIDISSNTNCDFNAVKASGVTGVIIRAGFGSDISQKDKAFDWCYDEAIKAGLDVGAYWFMYARNQADALIEAKTCNDALAGKSFPLGIYYDYEEDSIDYMDRCGECKTGMTDRIVAFIQAMLGYGWKRVRWYSNCNCIKGAHGADALDIERLKPYGLWLAEWTYNKDAVRTEYKGLTVVGQQYSNQNDGVNGINTCDMSVFNSAVYDYTDVTVIPTQETTQEEPQETVTGVTQDTYTVQQGDCLSIIAGKLGVNMDELAQLNNIEDVNKIYTGQVLQIPTVEPVQEIETASTYTVQGGDCLSTIAENNNTTVDNLVQLNGIENPDLIFAGQVLKLN